MAKIEIKFVDGSYDEWNEPATVFDRHDALTQQGLAGKALIDALITDDWGPPPSVVRIVGQTTAGAVRELLIAYD